MSTTLIILVLALVILLVAYARGMRHECAWCGKFMRGFRWSKEISHGICKKCKERVRKEVE
jgi:hypothetical protein